MRYFVILLMLFAFNGSVRADDTTFTNDPVVQPLYAPVKPQTSIGTPQYRDAGQDLRGQKGDIDDKDFDATDEEYTDVDNSDVDVDDRSLPNLNPQSGSPAP